MPNKLMSRSEFRDWTHLMGRGLEWTGKPHIRKHDGYWRCGFSTPQALVGVGSSPLLAYLHWCRL